MVNNQIIFQHNFCESRLQDDRGPEMFNACSSLIISIVPLCHKMVNKTYFKKVRYMLILNGGFSFYYHYSLSWLGKHLDEGTMLLANYYIMSEFIQYYDDRANTLLNIQNTCMLPVILAVNTIPSMDPYFSYIFTIYCMPTVISMMDYAKKYDSIGDLMIYGSVSFIGVISWLISENMCNEYTTYGHILWHLFFPLGIYRILLMFDEKLPVKIVEFNDREDNHIMLSS